MRMAAFPSSTPRLVAALACLLSLALPALAQQPKVRISSARCGLPPGRTNGAEDLPLCKFATWAPVYVSLEILDEVKETAELVVETPDADGVATNLAVPLHLVGLAPGTILAGGGQGPLPYIRPAAGGGETTITIRSATGAALSEPFRIRSLHPKDSSTYIVLSLGGKLPGFELPKAIGNNIDANPATGPLRGGRIELASIDDVEALPDQWFGYDTADLVVLGTGNEEFLRHLFGVQATPSELRKSAALVEWVRRGGRLVVSVGANAGLVGQLCRPASDNRASTLRALLPYEIDADAPTRSLTQLVLFWAARETSQTSTLGGILAVKGGTASFANLVPGSRRSGRVVIPPASRQSEDPLPVAVQGSFGLGKVTLVGFDLDRAPFTEFGMRAEFWDWVLREGGANRASIGTEAAPKVPSTGPTDEEDELAAAIRRHVDTFDGIPVISFGWVAAFIGLYILLIGPVEYYFLKRILGRLELTWITFPIIVLTVSAAAYFTALSVKGRELRINKIDVVDVVADLDSQTGKPGGRVFGTTWLTAFSPRIDTYTVAIAPAETWTAPGDTGASLVGWYGGPRSGRANLIRRRYRYHTNPEAGVVADALVDVPIQVWSTKSFLANWEGRMDPAAPVVESHLVHPPGDPTRAIGTFVNRMPFPEVVDCVAFYAGQAYPIGTIVNGQELRLVLDKGLPPTQWLQEKSQLAEIFSRSAQAGERSAPPAGRGGPPPPEGSLPLWGLLFHEAALRNEEGVIPRNASLRRLDQSWRLAADNRDEVLVVGRIGPKSGPVDAIFGGPNSPTRVWLKGVPEAGKAVPSIAGTGRQETYVRLYLPVGSSKPVR